MKSTMNKPEIEEQKPKVGKAIAALKCELDKVSQTIPETKRLETTSVAIKNLSAKLSEIEGLIETEKDVPAEIQEQPEVVKDILQPFTDLTDEVRALRLDAQDKSLPQTGVLSIVAIEENLLNLQKVFLLYEQPLKDIKDKIFKAFQEIKALKEPLNQLAVIVVAIRSKINKTELLESQKTKLCMAISVVKGMIDKLLQGISKDLPFEIVTTIQQFSAKLCEIEKILLTQETAKETSVTTQVLQPIIKMVDEIKTLRSDTKDLPLTPQQGILSVVEIEQELINLKEALSTSEQATIESTQDASQTLQQVEALKEPLEKLAAIVVEVKSVINKPEIQEQEKPKIRKALVALKCELEHVCQTLPETKSLESSSTAIKQLCAKLSEVESLISPEVDVPSIVAQPLTTLSSEIKALRADIQETATASQQGVLSVVEAEEEISNLCTALATCEQYNLEETGNTVVEALKQLETLKEPLEKFSVVVVEIRSAINKPEMQEQKTKVKNAIKALKCELDVVCQKLPEVKHLEVLVLATKQLSSKLSEIDSKIESLEESTPKTKSEILKTMLQPIMDLSEEITILQADVKDVSVVPQQGVLGVIELREDILSLQEAIIASEQFSSEEVADLTPRTLDQIESLKEPIQKLSSIIVEVRNVVNRPEIREEKKPKMKTALAAVKCELDKVSQIIPEAKFLEISSTAIQKLSAKLSAVEEMMEIQDQVQQSSKLEETVVQPVSELFEEIKTLRTKVQQISLTPQCGVLSIIEIEKELHTLQEALISNEQILREEIQTLPEQSLEQIITLQEPLQKLSVLVVELKNTLTQPELHEQQKPKLCEAVTMLKCELEKVSQVMPELKSLETSSAAMKQLSAKLSMVENQINLPEKPTKTESEVVKIILQPIMDLSDEMAALQADIEDVKLVPKRGVLSVIQLQKEIIALQEALITSEQFTSEKVVDMTSQSLQTIESLKEPLKKLAAVVVEVRSSLKKPDIREEKKAKMKSALEAVKCELDHVSQIIPEAKILETSSSALKQLSAKLTEVENLMDAEEKQLEETSVLKSILQPVCTLVEEIKTLKSESQNLKLVPQQGILSVAEIEQDLSALQEALIISEQVAVEEAGSEATTAFEQLDTLKEPLQKLSAVIVEVKNTINKPEIQEQQKPKISEALLALKCEVEKVSQKIPDSKPLQTSIIALKQLSAKLSEVDSMVNLPEEQVKTESEVIKIMLQPIMDLSEEIKALRADSEGIKIVPQQGVLSLIELEQEMSTLQESLISSEHFSSEKTASLTPEALNQVKALKEPLESFSAVIVEVRCAIKKPEVREEKKPKVKTALCALKCELDKISQMIPETKMLETSNLAFKQLSAKLSEVEKMIEKEEKPQETVKLNEATLESVAGLVEGIKTLRAETKDVAVAPHQGVMNVVDIEQHLVALHDVLTAPEFSAEKLDNVTVAAAEQIKILKEPLQEFSTVVVEIKDTINQPEIQLQLKPKVCKAVTALKCELDKVSQNISNSKQLETSVIVMKELSAKLSEVDTAINLSERTTKTEAEIINTVLQPVMDLSEEVKALRADSKELNVTSQKGILSVIELEHEISILQDSLLSSDQFSSEQIALVTPETLTQIEALKEPLEQLSAVVIEIRSTIRKPEVWEESKPKVKKALSALKCELDKVIQIIPEAKLLESSTIAVKQLSAKLSTVDDLLEKQEVVEEKSEIKDVLIQPLAALTEEIQILKTEVQNVKLIPQHGVISVVEIEKDLVTLQEALKVFEKADENIAAIVVEQVQTLKEPLEKLSAVVVDMKNKMHKPEVREEQKPKICSALGALKCELDKISQNIPESKPVETSLVALKKLSATLSDVSEMIKLPEKPKKTESEVIKAMLQPLMDLSEEIVALKADSKDIKLVSQQGVLSVLQLESEINELQEALITSEQFSSEEVASLTTQTLSQIEALKEPLKEFSSVVVEVRSTLNKPEVKEQQKPKVEKALEALKCQLENITQILPEVKMLKSSSTAIEKFSAKVSEVQDLIEKKEEKKGLPMTETLLEPVTSLLDGIKTLRAESQDVGAVPQQGVIAIVEMEQELGTLQEALVTLETSENIETISPETVQKIEALTEPIKQISAIVVQTKSAAATPVIEEMQKSKMHSALLALKCQVDEVTHTIPEVKSLNVLNIPLTKLSAKISEIDQSLTSEESPKKSTLLLKDFVQPVVTSTEEIVCLEADVTDLKITPKYGVLRVIEIKEELMHLKQVLSEVEQSAESKSFQLSDKMDVKIDLLKRSFQQFSNSVVQIRSNLQKPDVRDQLKSPLLKELISLRNDLDGAVQIISLEKLLEKTLTPIKNLSTKLADIENEIMTEESIDSKAKGIKKESVLKVLQQPINILSQEIKSLQSSIAEVKNVPEQGVFSITQLANSLSLVEESLAKSEETAIKLEDSVGNVEERINAVKEPLEKLSSLVVQIKNSIQKPNVHEQQRPQLRRALAALKCELDVMVQIPEVKTLEISSAPLKQLSAKLSEIEDKLKDEGKSLKKATVESVLQPITNLVESVKSLKAETKKVKVTSQQGVLSVATVEEDLLALQKSLTSFEQFTPEEIEEVNLEVFEQIATLKEPTEQLTAIIVKAKTIVSKPKIQGKEKPKMHKALSALKCQLDQVAQAIPERKSLESLTLSVQKLSAKLSLLEDEFQAKTEKKASSVTKLILPPVTNLLEEVKLLQAKCIDVKAAVHAGVLSVAGVEEDLIALQQALIQSEQVALEETEILAPELQHQVSSLNEPLEKLTSVIIELKNVANKPEIEEQKPKVRKAVQAVKTKLEEIQQIIPQVKSLQTSSAAIEGLSAKLSQIEKTIEDKEKLSLSSIILEPVTSLCDEIKSLRVKYQDVKEVPQQGILNIVEIEQDLSSLKQSIIESEHLSLEASEDFAPEMLAQIGTLKEPLEKLSKIIVQVKDTINKPEITNEQKPQIQKAVQALKCQLDQVSQEISETQAVKTTLMSFKQLSAKLSTIEKKILVPETNLTLTKLILKPVTTLIDEVQHLKAECKNIKSLEEKTVLNVGETEQDLISLKESLLETEKLSFEDTENIPSKILTKFSSLAQPLQEFSLVVANLKESVHKADIQQLNKLEIVRVVETLRCHLDEVIQEICETKPLQTTYLASKALSSTLSRIDNEIKKEQVSQKDSQLVKSISEPLIALFSEIKSLSEECKTIKSLGEQSVFNVIEIEPDLKNLQEALLQTEVITVEEAENLKPEVLKQITNLKEPIEKLSAVVVDIRNTVKKPKMQTQKRSKLCKALVNLKQQIDEVNQVLPEIKALQTTIIPMQKLSASLSNIETKLSEKRIVDLTFLKQTTLQLEDEIALMEKQTDFSTNVHNVLKHFLSLKPVLKDLTSSLMECEKIQKSKEIEDVPSTVVEKVASLKEPYENVIVEVIKINSSSKKTDENDIKRLISKLQIFCTETENVLSTCIETKIGKLLSSTLKPFCESCDNVVKKTLREFRTDIAVIKKLKETLKKVKGKFSSKIKIKEFEESGQDTEALQLYELNKPLSELYENVIEIENLKDLESFEDLNKKDAHNGNELNEALIKLSLTISEISDLQTFSQRIKSVESVSDTLIKEKQERHISFEMLIKSLQLLIDQIIKIQKRINSISYEIVMEEDNEDKEEKAAKKKQNNIEDKAQDDNKDKEKVAMEAEEDVEIISKDDAKKDKEDNEEKIKEAERKAKEEAERKEKEETEKKAKLEAEKKAKEEAEKKAKEEAEKNEKEKAEKKAKEEAEKETKEEDQKKAKLEEEKKLKEEAENKAKEEKEKKMKEEAERKAKEKAEKKAKLEAEKKAKEEAEKKTIEEAEKKAKEEAEIKEEAEKKTKEENEKRLHEEAEKKAKEENEKKLKDEAETKAKEEAEKKAKDETESEKEAEKKAKSAEEKRAKVEEENKTKEEAEKKTKLESEKKLKEEAAKKAKAENEKKLKEEAEKKSKEEAEKKTKEEAEKKSKEKAEKKAKLEAEKKVKEEAEKKAKEEDEKKAREESEKKMKEEVEKKAKEEAEKKAKEEAEKKAKEEAEKKAKLEAEKKAKEVEKKAKEEAEKKAKEEAEKKAQEENEKKLKEEAEKKTKEESEKKAKEKAEKKAKLEAEKKAKEEVEKKEKEEAVKKAKEEAEKKAQEENEKKLKEEAEKKAKEEAEKKAKEKAEKKAKLEAEKKAKEAENKAKEEAEKKAREEAEKKVKEEDEKKAKEEAEKNAKEEAEKKAKEETEKKAKLEAEKKLKEKAEKKAKEENEKKLKDEAEKKAKEEAEKKAREENEKKLKEEAEKKAKEEAEKKAKEKAEKKAKLEAEKKVKEEAEKKAKEEADMKAREETEKKVKEEFEKQAKEEAEKKAKEEAEKKAKEEAEKKAKLEAEKKVKEEAEKQAKEEAEKKAREEAEKKVKEEVEKKAKEEAEKKAKEETEKKAQKENEKKLKDEAEKKAKEEAEKKAKEKAEKKAKLEAEKKAKEAEKKAKEEAEKKAREEAEKKVKEEDEKKAKEEAEKKAKEEAEKKAKLEAEKKLKEEAEKKTKEEAEKKAKEETEKNAKLEAERKAKEEAEKKAKEDAEKKAKEEAKNKTKDETEKKAKLEEKKKAKEEAENKAKEEVERKAKEEAENKAKEEAEKKAKLEAEKKLKEEAEKKAIEEAEKKAKGEAEKKAKLEEKKKAKVEAENKAKEEVEKKAKEEAEKKAKEEAEKKVREEAEKRAKEEAEKKAKDENENKLKEEAEKKVKEEAEKKAKEEAEKKSKEEAEKIAKEEAENKVKDKAGKKVKLEEQKKAKGEAEKKIKEETEKAKKEIEKKAQKEPVHKAMEDEKTAEKANATDKVELQSKTNKEAKKTTKEKFDKKSKLLNEKDIEMECGVESGEKVATEMKKERKTKELVEIKSKQRSKENDTTKLEKQQREQKLETEKISNDSKNTFNYGTTIQCENEIYDKPDFQVKRNKQFEGKTFFDDDLDLFKPQGYHGPRFAERKPVFSTCLTDRSATIGSRVKLTCSVVDPKNVNLIWLKNGKTLTHTNKYDISFSNGLATLEILNTTTEDIGEYSCIAKNEHGVSTTSANLKILESFESTLTPPTFTRPLRDSYKISDDVLTLECRIRYSNSHKIKWYKDGSEVLNGGRYLQSYLADGICKLSIKNPDKSDTGRYTCRAESDLWSDQVSQDIKFTSKEDYIAEKTKLLNVPKGSRDHHKPYFSGVLTDHLVPSGGIMALQVEIKEPAEVTWFKESHKLPKASSRHRTFVEHGVHTLLIPNVTEYEAGKYTCRASNIFGRSETSSYVQVIHPSSIRDGKPAMFLSRPETVMTVTPESDIVVSFRITGDPKPSSKYYVSLVLYSQKKNLCDSNEFIGSIFS
jgi:chromosome segregation ATPase